MVLRSVTEKDPRQNDDCLRAHVARQPANGARLGELPGRRCDCTGAGSHPGRHSLTEKNGEPEAVADTLTSVQYITAQLLVMSHPFLLRNGMVGCIFVHRSFF